MKEFFFDSNLPSAPMPNAVHQFVSSVRWSNRQFARTDDVQGTMIHFQKCYSTMQEMFQKESCRLSALFRDLHAEIRFLDIACAPGGFSQFLLDHFPNSSGSGITLPESLGGFPVIVNGDHRYQLCYFDLLSHPLDPTPQTSESVDIVIGDAQYFPRTQEAVDEYGGRKAGTVTGGRIGLLLREFILAFEALKPGGVFIFRFVAWEKIHANILKLFFLCFDMFDSVEPFKSEYQHTADCTFYAVCSGFRREKYLADDIQTDLRVAYARVVLSPPFAAVHNGTINCVQVIDHPSAGSRVQRPDPVLDKPDAHILESLYSFRKIEKHEHFAKACAMFNYVYKMFLIGQSSYTDHSTRSHRDRGDF